MKHDNPNPESDARPEKPGGRAQSLFFSVLTACVLGFLLPYVMLKLGVDHAPGADPFITTIKDFTGLAVYFVLAAWLLGLSV